MKKLILFLFFTTSIYAKTYKVNTQHSFVNFEVDYMKVSVVKGAFEKFEGFFNWDKDSGKLSDVIFKIKATSINTRDSKRDNHLRRDDFFAVNEHPYLTFTSKNVTYEKGSPVKIKGLMEIRGVEKEVDFDLKWMGEHQDAVDKKKSSLFLKGNTILNRKDFDLNWNKALDQGGWVVGENVRVEIIVEANPTDATPAFSRFFLKKNSKIKKGALDLDKAITPSEEGKKKALNNSSDSKAVSKIPSHRDPNAEITVFDLILGFILFIAMGVIGYFLKKKLQDYFDTKMPELFSELLSDTFLFTFLFVTAWILAPLMGYQ